MTKSFLLADGIINRLTAERDHTRDVACALEAEAARLTEALERVAKGRRHCEFLTPCDQAPNNLSCTSCIVRRALAIDHGEA